MAIALEDLHRRHPGLTLAVCSAYAEAAAVCLGRHHVSPQAVRTTDERAEQSYVVTWLGPSKRQEAAWANRDDATRDGAYSVALAVVEAHLGMVTTMYRLAQKVDQARKASSGLPAMAAVVAFGEPRVALRRA